MTLTLYGRAIGKTEVARMRMSLMASGKYRLRKSGSTWYLTRGTHFALFTSFDLAWHFLFPVAQSFATLRNKRI